MSYLITENCIICGTCWEICPTESIKEFDWYYKIADTCVECGACAQKKGLKQAVTLPVLMKQKKFQVNIFQRKNRLRFNQNTIIFRYK